MKDIVAKSAAGLSHRLMNAVEGAVDAIGGVIAWFNFGMAGITCVVVILRYVFDSGAIFLQESVIYLHGAAFLLGLSYALRHNAHVRVDLFYSRMTRRARTVVDLAGHTLLLMPVAATILVVSWDYAGKSWAVLERSPEVAGIPAVFVLKTLLPVSAALLLAQVVVMGVRDLRALRGRG